MATIQQKQLFVWQDIENLGDLERLFLVLNYLPDEKLVSKLEELRENGRDKNPIRPVWNSIIAGVVFQHVSIESLRRELKRNAQLREVCGFDVLKGIHAVPISWAYSRFLKNLIRNQELIIQIFRELVNEIKGELPDLGKIIAFDGKAIHSYSPGKKKKSVLRNYDRRSDNDADWGVKEYKGKRADGTMWKKVKSWFGYRIHLIVDAVYELPIAFEVTKASKNEGKVVDKLFEQLDEDHSDIIDTCEYGIGDKGYDSEERIKRLWDTYKIKPVIDIRNTWQDIDETRVVKNNLDVVYNNKGDVFCICPYTGKQRKMALGGFEKDRESLKYLCPAVHYGYKCNNKGLCKVGKQFRININENRRIFPPIARSSYKWKSIYKKRTSVERVNGRFWIYLLVLKDILFED